MKGKLAVIAVAVLLVGTGAAMAAPGNAPDGVPADDEAQADDGQADDTPDSDEAANESDADENETDATEENADERRGPPADVPAAGDGASQGPPVDLPAQVPGFVSDIHDAVRSHTAGAAGSLGETVSSLTPDDESADAGNATDAPADTPAA